jgi:hypothetical protein
VSDDQNSAPAFGSDIDLVERFVRSLGGEVRYFHVAKRWGRQAGRVDDGGFARVEAIEVERRAGRVVDDVIRQAERAAATLRRERDAKIRFMLRQATCDPSVGMVGDWPTGEPSANG